VAMNILETKQSNKKSGDKTRRLGMSRSLSQCWTRTCDKTGLSFGLGCDKGVIGELPSKSGPSIPGSTGPLGEISDNCWLSCLAALENGRTLDPLVISE